MIEIWWFIDRDMVVHWWRCGRSLYICSGGSLIEIWWFIGGDVVDHYIYVVKVEIWWFIGEDKVSHSWRCDDDVAAITILNI